MTKELKKFNIDDLNNAITTYISDKEDQDRVITAYKYYLEYMDDERCISTLMILTGIYADRDTLIICILSYLLYSNLVSKDEVIEKYGNEIWYLSNTIVKLNKINFSVENDYLIEYYKKIFVGISDDVKVIVVKLADRLYEMRNLFKRPVAEQKSVAEETLEIIAPIAHHLGISKIKSELEDLSLRYLKPDVFYDIASRLNATKAERDNKVKEMIDSVSEILTEHNIHFEIKGRSKSIYSIYNKLSKGKKFSDIYDLFALRVLVSDVSTCYLVLGLIHSKFKPIPKRFKDFIAMPKTNGYQSLHTTIFGVDGILFEVQIRTYDMNEIAENGVAAHWSYKEKSDATNLSNTNKKLESFKKIIDNNIESFDFLDNFKDNNVGSIYAFTPKGDVIELPVGATPIDFAYKVHTKIGEMMTGAIVNNNIVPLNYAIQDNDIVKIITNKNSTPSRSWLKISKSNQTKNKIKSYFTKSNRENYIEKGKYNLDRELRKRHIVKNDFYDDKNMEIVLNELKLKSIDEVYLNIGNNRYTVKYVIDVLFKEDESNLSNGVVLKNVDNDIVVSDIDRVKVSLASCCSPIYGDNIVGYITRNNGISVHRDTCHNLDNLDDRIVLVSWGKLLPNKKYLSSIIVEVKNNGKSFDLLKKISVYDVSVDVINVITNNKSIIYEIDIYVIDVEQLNKVMDLLRGFREVVSVERIYR